jgi:hypothetical protein
MEIDEKLIPPGGYCYDIISLSGDGNRILMCHYWERHPEKPPQQTGYCHYLQSGDWEEDGTLLLWDGVKECGINREGSGEYEEPTNQEMCEWMERVLAYFKEYYPEKLEDEYKGQIDKRIEELKRMPEQELT